MTNNLHDKGTELKHEGMKDQVVGTLKETAGKITGNTELEAEGYGEKKIGDMERKTGKFVENVTK